MGEPPPTPLLFGKYGVQMTSWYNLTSSERCGKCRRQWTRKRATHVSGLVNGSRKGHRDAGWQRVTCAVNEHGDSNSSRSHGFDSLGTSDMGMPMPDCPRLERVELPITGKSRKWAGHLLKHLRQGTVLNQTRRRMGAV